MSDIDPAILANKKAANDAIPLICDTVIKYTVPGDFQRAGCAAYLFRKLTGADPTVEDMISILRHPKMKSAQLGQVDAIMVITDLIAPRASGKRGILVPPSPEPTDDTPKKPLDGSQKKKSASLNDQLSLNYSLVRLVEENKS